MVFALLQYAALHCVHTKRTRKFLLCITMMQRKILDENATALCETKYRYSCTRINKFVEKVENVMQMSALPMSLAPADNERLELTRAGTDATFVESESERWADTGVVANAVIAFACAGKATFEDKVGVYKIMKRFFNI